MKFGEPAPYELLRWEMMERFGWTPEELGALSLADIHEYIQVQDGKAKARPAPRKKR